MNRRSFFRGVVSAIAGLVGLGCSNQQVQPAQLPRDVDALTGPPDDGYVWQITYRINIVTGKITDYEAKRLFRTMASKPWRTQDKKTLRPVGDCQTGCTYKSVIIDL